MFTATCLQLLLKLFHFAQFLNSRRTTGTMNDTKNNNFGISDLIDNNPGITQGSSIHFSVCRKLLTFFECEWIFFNTIYGCKYGITHLNCICRCLGNKSNISSHFIDILKRLNTDPYLTRPRRCFLRFPHSDFAALRLIVGAASAPAIHCFIAVMLSAVPGNAGECISSFDMILISFLLARLFIARIALSFVISRVRVCIYLFYTITVKIQLLLSVSVQKKLK